MSSSPILLFIKLKRLVEASFLQSYPDCKEEIEDWKGQMIQCFQKDLGEKQAGYISEKWFYTHIKNRENTKLPRIDMLNLLANYAGFKNWETYLLEQKEQLTTTKQKDKKGYPKMSLMAAFVALGLVVITGLLLASFFYQKNIVQGVYSFRNKREALALCCSCTLL